MPTFKRAEADRIIAELYDRFHRTEYLEWDPLVVVRKAPARDREWVALLAALFAFGGVKQIIAAVTAVLKRLDGSFDDLDRKLAGFKHRIYVGEDVAALLRIYQRSVRTYGSLLGHFLHHHRPDAPTVEEALTGVIADFKAWAREDNHLTGPHFGHLLNSPADGGACKRWLMYLKWMVRADDGIDLGLWHGKGIRPDQLVIPLDVHLFRISRRLKLTRLRSANWKSAVQVTQSLSRLDRADPTKFDFSLCRFGMLNTRGLIDGLRPDA